VLPSFGSDLNVVVIGASGGLGTAFVRLLRASAQVATVHALSRAELDIARSDAIAAACHAIASPLDLVIVATGVLHDATHRPERNLAALDADWLAHNFAVNAAGPALVAQALLPKLRRDRKTAFAVLSARVGSIGDNRLGGWYSYRASKAALNQLIRTAAIEHARRNAQGLVVALHPGTVDSALSKPFQRGVNTLFNPIQSARNLLAVLDALTAAQSGGFFAWDGSAIEF